MEIHFELTFDDFLDALQVHVPRATAEHFAKRKKISRAIGIFLIIDAILLAVVGGLFLWSRRNWPFAIYRNVVGQTALSWIPIVPWLALIALSVTFGFAQRHPRRAGYIVGAVGIAVAAIGVGQFFLAFSYLAVAQGNLSEMIVTPFTAGNLFGWGVLLLLWLTMTFTAARLPAKLWKQFNVHGPETFQFRTDGFCSTTEHRQSDYHWEAIQGIADAPTVLLLYVNDATFHIVPKRAFESEEARQAFWKLVPERLQISTSGFPVLAIAPPAPPQTHEPRSA